MAGNIKGIKIEFEGDTTRLDKALRSVDKSTAKIDKELKKVNTGLKFNPTSVELWKQKQTLLTQKVEETKKKLDALKQAQAQLDDDPAVDKESEEYRQLQREIIETESKLKHFESELKKIGNANLQALGRQLQQIGKKAQDVGKAMTKYITGPIVAAGAGSVKAFQEVDEGLDIVNAKTGATGDELERMREIAENMATEIPVDFQTAGTAVGEVATRFHLTGDELDDLSTKFVQFAQINNTDVNSAIDQTQKALSAFGMDASEAGTLLDQLNVVGQNTGANMDSLLGGLIQNGTAFQELGLNAYQAATLMGELETSGANSETVMQGLRKALKNAAAEGIPLDEALAQLQDTIVNGTDDMDGLTAAYDLFGKSGDQIYGAVKNGTIDFANLGEEVAAAGNSVNDTFMGMLDPGDRFALMMNQVKVLGYEVGGTILQMLAPALEKLSNFLTGLTEKWNNLSPGMQKFITTVAGIAAVAGPVVFIIGTILTKIGMLLTFLPAISGALGTVAGAFSFLVGPVGIVIGIIAALIAIGVLLYKNWDTIKTKLTALKTWIVNTWTKIKTSVTNTVNSIKSAVTQAWDSIKTKVANVVDGIKTKVSSGFESVKTTAQNVWNKIKKAITDPIESAKDKVSNIIDKIKGMFPFSVGRLFKGLTLPHFSLNWSSKDFGPLGSIKYPTGINVRWYAQGGIFDSPAVIGVGEAGPEAVIPIDKLQSMLYASNRQLLAGMGGLEPVVINVYGSDNMSVNELAAAVETRIIQMQKRRSQAWA